LSDEAAADQKAAEKGESKESSPESGAPPSVQEGDASPALANALESPPTEDPAEAYHQRARLAEDRLAEVLAAYRKLKTENDGYRERITRNIERRYEQRRERLLLKFIDILDNMDRALDAAEKTYAGEPLIEVLILVRTQLLQTLQEEGLDRIPVLGLPYDPSVSEAVGTQEVTEVEHHHVVVKEHMRGYRLNGRVARASRVVIGEYPGGVAEPAAPAPAAESQPSGVPAAALAGTPSSETTEPEDITPPPPPPSSGAPAAPAQESPEEGPSLEEIIARAEAQEALFPDAFEEDEDDEKR
jgi:molecular chaperone GrpE